MEFTTPVIMIEGAVVALGPLRRELIPLYQRWFNDLATLRTLGQIPAPMTLEAEERWFERVLEPAQRIFFTIYLTDGRRPIGNADLRDIDYRNRTAEFGIAIGEADARGKGYGTEATRLVLDYAFTALGLHSVALRVGDYNPAAKRAYEKAGFRTIGRRRESQMIGGRLRDMWYMDCLSAEFIPGPVSRIYALDQGQTAPDPTG